MSKLVPLKFRAKVIADYFVDPQNGDIYSGKRSTLLKMTPSYDDGYMKINICSPDLPKSQRVHRLVAETLIPFPCPVGITKAEWKATPQSVKNLLCSQYRVNHIDHDKSNYHPTNLEWVTARGNSLAYVAHSNSLGV
jgi:hypothetical protein